MRRVGFVLHVMQVAGAEVLVHEIITRLGARIDPVIYCLDGLGQLGQASLDAGFKVVLLGRIPGLDVGLVRRFARQLRADRIEVLHAHQYTPFFYSALANARNGGAARVIFTEHGRHFPDHVSSKRRLLNRYVLQHLASEVNAVAAFSAQAVHTIDGFTRWPPRVIPNGIRTDAYGDRAGTVQDARRALGLPVDRRYIVCVARFHPVKNHRCLLDAFAQVASQLPDVDLVLAGDGELRGDLERQAAALGLTRRVHPLGVRSDVPLVLRAATVFAMASLSEGASLTVIEAMASGLPVVITNVGGNPELVRHEIEGLLVPRDDATALAAALERILGRPEEARALGEAGRARAREEYDLGVTVRRYSELYGV